MSGSRIGLSVLGVPFIGHKHRKVSIAGYVAGRSLVWASVHRTRHIAGYVAGQGLVGYVEISFYAVPTTAHQLDFIQFIPTVHVISEIASYLWAFGDGKTSAVRSPRHYYRDIGTYTVKLDVWTAIGEHFEYTRNDYITITATVDPFIIDDFSDRAENLVIEEVQNQFGRDRTTGDTVLSVAAAPVIEDKIIDFSDRAENLIITELRQQYGQG